MNFINALKFLVFLLAVSGFNELQRTKPNSPRYWNKEISMPDSLKIDSLIVAELRNHE